MSRGGSMNLAKTLIAVVAIACALKFQIAAGNDLASICRRLNEEMAKYPSMDGGRAFTIADRELRGSNLPYNRNDRLKLADSWGNIYKGEPCSKSSWDYLHTMSECMNKMSFKELDEPMRAYAKKCIKTDDFNRKIKKGPRRFFPTDVSFIDDEFINKFYKDNPKDPQLHLNMFLTREPGQFARSRIAKIVPDWDKNCCRATPSHGAVNNAIQRYLTRKGKDVKNEFYANRNALSKFLDSKLFEPCKEFTSSYRNVVLEMSRVAKYIEGGQEAVLQSLDQEARNILFRFNYCSMLAEEPKPVSDAAAAEFT